MLSVILSQYHACWCHGSWSCQSFDRIYQTRKLEYSVSSIKRLNCGGHLAQTDGSIGIGEGQQAVWIAYAAGDSVIVIVDRTARFHTRSNPGSSLTLVSVSNSLLWLMGTNSKDQHMVSLISIKIGHLFLSFSPFFPYRAQEKKCLIHQMDQGSALGLYSLLGLQKNLIRIRHLTA